MEMAGREYLRQELKKKGEADTVEDMLRIGFHWPPLITVKHLHMHFIYPIRELGILSRILTFRPGKVFKELSDVIADLKQKAGETEPSTNAEPSGPEDLSAHAICN
ncbi:unnamed protein product [Auanema sp. JU1783]|nr:unnamed protein product [Auanema sp. JU1783]